MFIEQIPLAEKLLRTVLVYGLVAVLIRLTGKRGLAGLNTLDIVVVILLSNVVQNSIIGDDLSVTGGAVGAVALVGVDQLLNRLAVRYAAIERLFDGTPTKLMEHGRTDEVALRRVGLTDKDLEHAVHLQNADKLGQVKAVELDPGGQLIVTLHDREQGATKADIADLRTQLDRVEAALAART